MSAMARTGCVPGWRALVLVIALGAGAVPAFAQVMDHSKMRMPPATKPAAKQPVSAKKKPATTPAAAQPQAIDPHAGHHMPATHAPLPAPATGHEMAMPSALPRAPIPVLTDADRIAASAEVAGHPAHDEAIEAYWSFDRLEGWNADAGGGVEWEVRSWIGTDLDRAWLRSQGERIGGVLESADLEVLYGRSVSSRWDVVAGIRHDFGEDPSQTFAAIGVMGLAPLKLEVAATAYAGRSGQTAVRLEAEYETLLTNRLILQWQAQADFSGREDARRGIGSGLGTVEAGLRLRYELTRRFAPYIGVAWERAHGGTAEFRRALDGDIDETRFVAGLRIWF